MSARTDPSRHEHRICGTLRLRRAPAFTISIRFGDAQPVPSPPAWTLRGNLRWSAAPHAFHPRPKSRWRVSFIRSDHATDIRDPAVTTVTR